MNLQPITKSVVLAPALDRITNGTPRPMRQGTQWEVGNCNGSAPAAFDCGRRVFADTGYADLDGAPFRAYHCDICAAKILTRSQA